MNMKWHTGNIQALSGHGCIEEFRCANVFNWIRDNSYEFRRACNFYGSLQSWPESQLPASDSSHIDVLDDEVIIDSVVGALPANPGLFDATERGYFIGHQSRIDIHRVRLADRLARAGARR